MPLPPAPIRLLLIEDDFDVAAGLGAYLEARGVAVEYAYTASAAMSRVTEKTFDLLVMDVQLPDGDGVALCRELKRMGLRSPVLFLTARAALQDKLIAFDAGAVDYMAKPFAPAELLARARALVSNIPTAGGASIRLGRYSLDPVSGLLSSGGKQLSLNRTALLILRRLMEVSPGTVTRDELHEVLWGGNTPDSDPLRMHIYELRQALRVTFGDPLIETVRGLGYRIGTTR